MKLYIYIEKKSCSTYYEMKHKHHIVTKWYPMLFDDNFRTVLFILNHNLSPKSGRLIG